MYTPEDFILIEKGLEIAKDKGKYLESFEIPLVAVTPAFLPHKHEISLSAWKNKLNASFKQELDNEFSNLLQPEEADLSKKLAVVREKMDTNRKRRRDYK